jgi:hypothetical protein
MSGGVYFAGMSGAMGGVCAAANEPTVIHADATTARNTRRIDVLVMRLR